MKNASFSILRPGAYAIVTSPEVSQVVDRIGSFLELRSECLRGRDGSSCAAERDHMRRRDLNSARARHLRRLLSLCGAKPCIWAAGPNPAPDSPSENECRSPLWPQQRREQRRLSESSRPLGVCIIPSHMISASCFCGTWRTGGGTASPPQSLRELRGKLDYVLEAKRTSEYSLSTHKLYCHPSCTRSA